MIFEIFCVDQKGKVKFKDEERFIDALSINDELWIGQLKRDYINCIINDDQQGLKITIDAIDTSKVVADLFTSAFIVKVEAAFEIIEPFRFKLLQHLRYLGFNHLRILTDDSSTRSMLKNLPAN